MSDDRGFCGILGMLSCDPAHVTPTFTLCCCCSGLAVAKRTDPRSFLCTAHARAVFECLCDSGCPVLSCVSFNAEVPSPRCLIVRVNSALCATSTAVHGDVSLAAPQAFFFRSVEGLRLSATTFSSSLVVASRRAMYSRHQAGPMARTPALQEFVVEVLHQSCVQLLEFHSEVPQS